MNSLDSENNNQHVKLILPKKKVTKKKHERGLEAVRIAPDIEQRPDAPDISIKTSEPSKNVPDQDGPKKSKSLIISPIEIDYELKPNEGETISLNIKIDKSHWVLHYSYSDFSNGPHLISASIREKLNLPEGYHGFIFSKMSRTS